MRNLSLGISVFLFTFAVSCSSSNLTKANQLAQQGNATEARLHYKKALQKDPLFGEAHYRLGLLELKENQIREAYDALNAAVDLSPENQDAKVKLADLCIKMYSDDPARTKSLYDQVAGISNDLLEKNPQSYDGLRLRAHVAVLDRLPARAVDYFRRAQLIHPLDRENTLALAQSLTQLGEDTQSERVLRSAIETDKTYGPAYDALYLHLMKRKLLAGAEQLLKDKVRANPKEPAYVLELAAHYASSGKPAASKEIVDQLLRRENEFPNVRLLAGEFFVRRGNLGEALAQFHAGLKDHPQDGVSYRKGIVTVLLIQHKRDEGLGMIEGILSEKPYDNEALLIRANLWIDTANPGRIRAAVKELEGISIRDAKVPGVHLAMGRALWMLGESGPARSELLAAARENQSYVEANLLLAETELRNKNGNQALAHADAVLARLPQSRQASLLRVKALMSIGNLAAAGAALESYRKDHPQDLDGELQYGLLHIARKKYDAAEAVFRKLYRPGQQDVRPLEGLVNTYVAARKPEKALALLQEELKQSNGSAAIRNVLAATDDRWRRLVAGDQEAGASSATTRHKTLEQSSPSLFSSLRNPPSTR